MVFKGQFATPGYGGCNHEDWYETVSCKLKQNEDVFKVLSFLLSSRKSITAEFDEKQYLFLKRLCQVLVALGEVQLYYLWVRREKVC